MTNNTGRAPSELARDDRILPTTKIALIIVVPFPCAGVPDLVLLPGAHRRPVRLGDQADAP